MGTLKLKKQEIWIRLEKQIKQASEQHVIKNKKANK